MGANKNGVIITVYVESLTNHSKNNRNVTKRKKWNAKPIPGPFLRRGYDRRSQLLAYAQSLRNDNGKRGSYHPQLWSKKKKSWPKSKKWRWSPSLGKIPLRFHGLCWRRKYKSRANDEQSELECLLGREKLINLRKRKARKTSTSQFWRRLRIICIGLICAWQCNKGAEQKI